MKLVIWLVLFFWSLPLYATNLSDAAAALGQGAWVEVSTTGLTNSILAPGGPSDHILQFADSATWDPVGRKFYFMGVSHGNAVWTFMNYTDSTNAWGTIAPHSDFVSSLIGHAYDHNAFDTANGVYYHRLYNSTQVYKYVVATGVWSKLPVVPMANKQVAGGIEYFPERGGLVFVDGDWGIWLYNIAGNSWSRIANTNGESGGGFFKATMGGYHVFAEYNPVSKYLWFGGGQGSTASYRLDQNGNFSTAATAPFPLGILNTIISCDPNTGKYLVFGSNQTFYEYDIVANTWTLQPSNRNPPWFTDTADGPVLATVEAPISNYGVTMYVTYKSNSSKVRIYKHGATAADTTPPSTPTNLTAVPTSATAIDLTWTASTDNIAVAGYRLERCTGAGCVNFLEIALPSNPGYSNISLTTGTTYRYRVRAIDTSNNLSGYSSIATATTGTSGGATFAERCAAAGVVRCFGFDVAGDFNIGAGGFNGGWGQNYGIFPPYSTQDYTRATQDTTVKASGASSLRFRIPTNSPADTSGSWFTNFSSDLNTRFGPGQTFFVQWRQRFDPAFINTNYLGSAGFKQVILGTGDRPGVCNPAFPTSATCPTSCTELEIVTTSKEKVINSTTSANLVVGYHSCLFFEGFEYFDASQGQVVTQNGPNPDCLHPAFNIPPCISYAGDEWMTFKMRVTIGTWNTNDSTVQIWAGRHGQPLVLVIDFRPGNGHGVVLHNSNPSTDLYGKLWLLPYQTGKDNSQAHAETYTWFDELIISTQDIADPATGGEAPAPPTGFTRVP